MGFSMQIATRKVYDVLVVEMAGRLDSRTAGDAGDRLTAIAQGPDKQVVLNLEKLDYVSSAGLRAILVCAKLLQNGRGQLNISNANGNVAIVLETTGLASLIRAFPTEKDAVAAFSRG
jgi:anti-anti-sigma factor